MNQKGFAPIIIIAIVALVGIMGGTAYVKFKARSLPQTTEQSASASEDSTPESSTPSASPKPTTTKGGKITATPTPTPTTTSTNSNTNLTSPVSTLTPAPTSTPTPNPTSTPTPTPPLNRKSYTWSGTNVSATVSCYIGDRTFDVIITGDVSEPLYGNGIWTTLTGDDKTIITSYQGSMSAPHIGLSYNDQVDGIRPGGPITLKASNTYTYGYELKVYYAPYTNGIPTLTNQVDSVSFAIDCSK